MEFQCIYFPKRNHRQILTNRRGDFGNTYIFSLSEIFSRGDFVTLSGETPNAPVCFERFPLPLKLREYVIPFKGMTMHTLSCKQILAAEPQQLKNGEPNSQLARLTVIVHRLAIYVCKLLGALTFLFEHCLNMGAHGYPPPIPALTKKALICEPTKEFFKMIEK